MKKGDTESADDRTPNEASDREGQLTEDERLLQSTPAGIPHLVRRQDRVNKDSWRMFRILGEFVEGFDALSDLGPAVSFFGSARVSDQDPTYQQCVETARLIGEAGFNVITGGGPGLMQAANQGASEAGVVSVGCNIELPFEQHVNPYVDLEIDFRYFFVRKTMFVKYAQAFVIFPGGYGTLDELFESLTLIQTGKVRDFPVVLVGTDYWRGLIEWIRDTVTAQGMVSAEGLDLIFCTDSPQEVADYVVHHYNENAHRAEAE